MAENLMVVHTHTHTHTQGGLVNRNKRSIEYALLNIYIRDG